MPRFLTHVQSDRLDDLADTGERITVIGWDDRAQGPLLSYPDGRQVALTALGRLNPRRNRMGNPHGFQKAAA